MKKQNSLEESKPEEGELKLEKRLDLPGAYDKLYVYVVTLSNSEGISAVVYHDKEDAEEDFNNLIEYYGLYKFADQEFAENEDGEYATKQISPYYVKQAKL